jgi:hypothetical protein
VCFVSTFVTAAMPAFTAGNSVVRMFDGTMIAFSGFDGFVTIAGSKLPK